MPHSHPAPTRRVVVLPPVERLVPDLAEALPVSQAKFEDLGVAEGAEKGEEEGEFCREGLWGGGGEGAHARLVEPAAEVKGREGGEGGLEEGDQGRVSRLWSRRREERWVTGLRVEEKERGQGDAPWRGGSSRRGTVEFIRRKMEDGHVREEEVRERRRNDEGPVDGEGRVRRGVRG